MIPQPITQQQYSTTQQVQCGQSLIEQEVLERIKFLQKSERKGWQGVNALYCGIPGTTTLNDNERTRLFPNEREYIEASENIFEILREIYDIITTAPLSNLTTTLANKRMSEPQYRNSGTNFMQNGNNEEQNCQFSNQNYIKFKFQELMKQHIHQTSKNNLDSQQNMLDIYSEQIIQRINQNVFLQTSEQSKPSTLATQNRQVLFKILKCDAKLVRFIFELNGLETTDRHDWNLLWTNNQGTVMTNKVAKQTETQTTFSQTSYFYERLIPYQQKINHFPGSNEITRKDKMALNIRKMQQKYSHHYFNFIPETFVLPEEYQQFETAFYRRLQSNNRQNYSGSRTPDQGRNLWIVKPAGLSRGRGIYIVNNPSQVCLKSLQGNEKMIISRYIESPLLLQGHKFDLRIYVVVTCYDPLRIYVYREGLVRFASEKYNVSNACIPKETSTGEESASKFAHLTNYSINKKNDKYVQNENVEEDDSGFKWSLGALNQHFEMLGIDINLMWSKIYDVIIKCLLSVDEHIKNKLKSANIHRSNCYELFGYDILLDNNLDPWVMEVNLSPSLAFESPLDLKIKGNLLKDIFNLIGVPKQSYSDQVRNKKQSGKDVLKPDLIEYHINANFDKFIDQSSSIIYNDDFKSYLKQFSQQSLKSKEIVLESMLEFQRRGNFVRIYPSQNTGFYDCFLSQQGKYSQQLLQQSLYSEGNIFKNELNAKQFKEHLRGKLFEFMTLNFDQIGSDQLIQEGFQANQAMNLILEKSGGNLLE